MIHPTAIIHPKAKLAKNVSVGPYCVIGPEVTIGASTVLHAHVVVQGQTVIGEENEIYSFTVLGGAPQDLKYKGGARLWIGSRNIIREHVTIHASSSPEHPTRIGNKCFIMGQVHIAHDCIIGNNVVLTQRAVLGGHVEVGDYANLSGDTAYHQFVRIGRFAMPGSRALVLRDLPPFSIAVGSPATYLKCNRIALERASFSPDTIEQIERALSLLFHPEVTREDAIKQIKAECCGEEIQEILAFVESSKRGLVPLRAKKKA